jgi:hypothetical protein
MLGIATVESPRNTHLPRVFARDTLPVSSTGVAGFVETPGSEQAQLMMFERRFHTETPQDGVNHEVFMHVSPRGITASQYELAFFDHAVSGERFPDRIIRSYDKPDYRLEAWVLPGQHVLRFEHRGVSASELVTDHQAHWPHLQPTAHFPCAGEREFEHRFKGAVYMTTVVTETLAQNLFRSTLQETVKCAEEESGVICRWEDTAGACVSVLEVQSEIDQIHVQAYHMIASQGLVVRTQSLFELARKPALAM